jgi:predicted nucleotide-binding protein
MAFPAWTRPRSRWQFRSSKETVARFLEGLDIEAIILHEQPSRSLSVIEKIEAFGTVDFAVVLMTPDDVGALASGQ